jgi:hypothetical protein
LECNKGVNAIAIEVSDPGEINDDPSTSVERVVVQSHDCFGAGRVELACRYDQHCIAGFFGAQR